MKKYLLILTIVSGVLPSLGQTFSGQMFVQQTVMGLQKGYGLRYQAYEGLGIGILFQSNGKISSDPTGNPFPFYGMEAIIPLAKYDNLSFFLTPKVGFVNKYFFVLIPEAETAIKIFKDLSVGITAGIRARQSSAGAKVILHL